MLEYPGPITATRPDTSGPRAAAFGRLGDRGAISPIGPGLHQRRSGLMAPDRHQRRSGLMAPDRHQRRSGLMAPDRHQRRSAPSERGAVGPSGAVGRNRRQVPNRLPPQRAAQAPTAKGTLHPSAPQGTLHPTAVRCSRPRSGTASVTAASVTAASVTAASVTAATVTAASVTAASITAASVTAASVTAASITAASVTAASITAASVTAASVRPAPKAGTCPARPLRSPARPRPNVRQGLWVRVPHAPQDGRLYQRVTVPSGRGRRA